MIVVNFFTYKSCLVQRCATRQLTTSAKIQYLAWLSCQLLFRQLRWNIFYSTRRNETPQTFTCFLQGPFGPRSRCLALGSRAVNRRWKWKGTGASSSHQARQNSRPGIGYTNRCLSEWNPYWLTRLIDSAAPATNCRLRLPPSVCNGDSGVSSYTPAPPAYQI